LEFKEMVIILEAFLHVRKYRRKVR